MKTKNFNFKKTCKRLMNWLELSFVIILIFIVTGISILMYYLFVNQPDRTIPLGELGSPCDLEGKKCQNGLACMGGICQKISHSI